MIEWLPALRVRVMMESAGARRPFTLMTAVLSMRRRKPSSELTWNVYAPVTGMTRVAVARMAKFDWSPPCKVGTPSPKRPSLPVDPVTLTIGATAVRSVLVPAALSSVSAAVMVVTAVVDSRSSMKNPGVGTPNPRWVVALVHSGPGTKSGDVQLAPAMAAVGMATWADAPAASRVVAVNGAPNASPSSKAGKAGLYALTRVEPSGLINARYSPPEASEKFVCSLCGSVVRFLLEAHTTRNPPGGRLTPAGKAHFRGFESLSVKCQPERSTVSASGLCSSIQSEASPSSSNWLPSLAATSSVISGSARSRDGSSAPASRMTTGQMDPRAQNDRFIK